MPLPPCDDPIDVFQSQLDDLKRQAEILACLPEDCLAALQESDCLHSPAVLDIGSESPEEIALSITAEVSARLAGREGGFLRQRQRHAPVHTAILAA